MDIFEMFPPANPEDAEIVCMNFYQRSFGKGENPYGKADQIYMVRFEGTPLRCTRGPGAFKNQFEGLTVDETIVLAEKLGWRCSMPRRLGDLYNLDVNPTDNRNE